MWVALLLVAGLGFVVVGAFVIHLALGLVTTGASLYWLGILLARGRKSEQ